MAGSPTPLLREVTLGCAILPPMRFRDEAEAREIVKGEIERLRSRSYEELICLREPRHFEVIGPRTGIRYAAEAQAVWDDVRRRSGNLRVMVLINEAPLKRPTRAIVEDFIVRSDGSFAGE